MLWSNEKNVLDCNVMSGCECSNEKYVLNCNVMSGCEGVRVTTTARIVNGQKQARQNS
jgi:hypothetical protein